MLPVSAWMRGTGVLLLLTAARLAESADWPMWRCDAGRTARAPAELPADLELLWTRTLSPRQPAWEDPLNRDLMTYDRLLEPVVMDGRLFVGLNDRDQLLALDATTGEPLWSCFADAPVRLPPVGANGRVYFCSDDGRLYCVNAEDGRPEWSFRGGPTARLALGNGRVISAWPARRAGRPRRAGVLRRQYLAVHGCVCVCPRCRNGRCRLGQRRHGCRLHQAAAQRTLVCRRRPAGSAGGHLGAVTRTGWAVGARCV